jgi:hypothetical protein
MISGGTERNNAFVVIRYLSDLSEYAIEYGSSDSRDLRSGPRFRSLDHAIAWVEGLDESRAASGREIGDH